jgi:hypothetical protein
MQIVPVSIKNTNFKGRVIDSPALKKITKNADKETLKTFSELVKKIENTNDNMVFKFNIERPRYKMLSDNIRVITDFVLNKLDTKTGKEDTFTIEERYDSYSRPETNEKRYSDILKIFIKHFNEEVYPEKEIVEKNKFDEMLKNSILGDK